MATNGPRNSEDNGKTKAVSEAAEEVKDTVKEAARDVARDVKSAARRLSDADDERRAVREDRERLAYDFKEMLSSAEALLKSTAKYTGAEVEEARARLQDQLDLARARSGDLRESVRDAGQRLATQADECVHRHPWQSIGVAFVLGMVFAHCTRSRNN